MNRSPTASVRPSLVAHADWGTHPKKRWMARAILDEAGHYVAHASELVGDTGSLLNRLLSASGPDGCVLLGFDFPIGLPVAYATQIGIASFLELLPRLGTGDWAEFYDVAERPDQIHLRRPFFPQRCWKKGQARQQHLLAGLRLTSVNDLRRRCDRGYLGRRPACPLFWTVGGQQVGKAAISGWRDVLGPAQRAGKIKLSIWPFSGPLLELFRPRHVVVAETYPAEFYGHLGVDWRGQAGRRKSKRRQRDRQDHARVLLGWAHRARVKLTTKLGKEIRDGFGPRSDGEDRFDAVVGLFGMINVVLGHRSPGTPDDEAVRRTEGWILGQVQG